MGTPEFAATILAGLIAAGHRVRAVYTQPPRPAGRGHRLQPSPVQLLAESHGLPVHCPANLRSPETQAEFAAIKADAALVAAYGLILPSPVLAAPRLGCLNVHASLLPRWRGAAPIQRAILAGDRETGVTIMQMDEGLDTGPILLQQAVPILPETTAGELADTLAGLGARLMVAVLDGVATGRLAPRPQPPDGVTYAPKRRASTCRPAPCSTIASRSPAAPACSARSSCSARGAAPSTRMPSCAAFRSRPGPSCRAPLPADHRI